MMNGKDGVMTGIAELRAKAAQLTGNEYYMIVQELDALAGNLALSEDGMREALAPIAARLESAGAAAQGTPGMPDIPAPPDSPAQPDLVPTPEIPPAPDSPAQPDVGPMPDIPPPPDSPASPDAPPGPEMSGAEPLRVGGGAIAGMDEPAEPAASSAQQPSAAGTAAFGEAAAPADLTLTADAPAEEAASVAPLPLGGAMAGSDEPEASPTHQPASVGTTLSEAAETADLTLTADIAAERSASPAAEAATVEPLPLGGAIAGSDDRLSARISPAAAVEQTAFPVAATGSPATLGTSPEAGTEFAFEADPDAQGGRNGFDALADASWQRVQDVMNRAQPTPQASKSQTAAPEPVPAGEPAASRSEGTAPQAAEAIRDGGSESRSSGAPELFSSSTEPMAVADSNVQSSGEAALAVKAATGGEAAAPAEAAALKPANLAGGSGEAKPAAVSVQEAASFMIDADASAELSEGSGAGNAAMPVSPLPSHPAEKTLAAVQAALTEVSDGTAAGSLHGAKSSSAPAASAAQTVPTLAGADLASSAEEPEAALAAAMQNALAAADAEVAQAAASAEPAVSATALRGEAEASARPSKEPSDADLGKEKATRRGFFRRLFGGRETAHR